MREPISPDQSHSPSPSKSHQNLTTEPSLSSPVPENITSWPTSASTSVPASAMGFLFSPSSPKQPAMEAATRRMASSDTLAPLMDWQKDTGVLYNPSGIGTNWPTVSRGGEVTGDVTN